MTTNTCVLLEEIRQFHEAIYRTYREFLIREWNTPDLAIELAAAHYAVRRALVAKIVRQREGIA